MQVLPPVQLAWARVRGAAVREGRAPARPPARRAMDPRRPRSRQARPSRARRPMDPRRLGRDKRDPPVPGAQWTRAASVATSATLPCAVSAGLPCGAVVGADVLGGPCVRWRFRVRAAPPRPRQARPSRRPGAQWTRAALGRDKRDPPVPGAQWTRAALGRDKRDPPVRRIRRVTVWCRGRGRRPRRPACPMAFPCTGRSQSKYWSYLLEQRVASMLQ